MRPGRPRPSPTPSVIEFIGPVDWTVKGEGEVLVEVGPLRDTDQLAELDTVGPLVLTASPFSPAELEVAKGS